MPNVVIFEIEKEDRRGALSAETKLVNKIDAGPYPSFVFIARRHAKAFKDDDKSTGISELFVSLNATKKPVVSGERDDGPVLSTCRGATRGRNQTDITNIRSVDKKPVHETKRPVVRWRLGDGPRPKQSGLGAMIASDALQLASDELGSVRTQKGPPPPKRQRAI
jgi:hypothetical protein